MNRIENLFSKKSKNILNVYCTAGFPKLDSTITVMQSLQHAGADMIELGMPYSDPLADGPVIQASKERASEAVIALHRAPDALDGEALRSVLGNVRSGGGGAPPRNDPGSPGSNS